jgi:FkbM family methyltransferase
MLNYLKFFAIILLKKIPTQHLLSFTNLFTKAILYKTILDIRTLGFEIKNIYDIGAYKGNFSKDLNLQFPKMKFFLFEANVLHGNDLKKTSHWYHIGVLSNVEKKISFFSKEGGTGDSYFKENTLLYKDVTPKYLKSQTLDDVVANKKIPLPDFIKIDTQGAELDILKGAQNCLKKTRMILLECPIYQYNLGAPNMSDYVNYLLDFSFYPARCIEIHDMHGVLVQIDILFMSEELLNKSNIDFKKFYLK